MPVTFVKSSKEGSLFITPSIGNATESDVKKHLFYVRIETEPKMVRVQNRITMQKRGSIMLFDKETLKLLNVKEGGTMQGTIIMARSYHPFSEKQECVQNPNTRVPVLVNGLKIYQQFLHVDDENALDIALPSVVPTNIATTVVTTVEEDDDMPY